MAQALLAAGAALALAGLAGTLWCAWRAWQLRGSPDPKAELQRLAAWNLAAVGGAALGLGAVVAGLLLRT